MSKKTTSKNKNTVKKAAKKVAAKKTPVTKGKKAGAKAVPVKKAAGSAGVFHIYDETAKKFVPVEKARPVKLKGFESFTFFAHPAPEGQKGWIVSEAISGAKFAAGASLAQARSQAQKRLAEIDAQRLGENIRTVTTRNGIAPGRALPKKPTKTPNADASAESQGLRDQVIAALGTDKPQVHFDDLVKATGGAVDAVAAALMVLELEHKVKSLPGKFYRLPKADEAKATKGNRGGKPRGKMSLLDAAVEIMKGTKKPLSVKEITRVIFEQGLAASNGRTPHATLSAAMGREVAGKGTQSRFRRAERGRFELNA